MASGQRRVRTIGGLDYEISDASAQTLIPESSTRADTLSVHFRG